MDKTGFLRELERYLAVLNEEEQKDILDEYAQHIDMKMERGMSEAEAIGDFGDIEELAGQILEAYHVNPKYQAKKRKKLLNKEDIPVVEITETGKHFWGKAVGFCKRMYAGAKRGLAKGWKFLCKPFVLAGEAWKTRKTNMAAKHQEEDFVKAMHTEKSTQIRRKKMFGEIPGMTTRGIRKLLYGIYSLAAWCIRWTWNLCLFFVAMLTGLLMLFSLFGLGMLAVLLAQGYLLVGFTVGCLGLVLCSGALTVIVLGLCRIRTRERQKEETIEQEVQEYA